MAQYLCVTKCPFPSDKNQKLYYVDEVMEFQDNQFPPLPGKPGDGTVVVPRHFRCLDADIEESRKAYFESDAKARAERLKAYKLEQAEQSDPAVMMKAVGATLATVLAEKLNPVLAKPSPAPEPVTAPAPSAPPKSKGSAKEEAKSGTPG